MNLSAMKYVAWSEKAQTCKDVMANHPAPLLVRVEQGYCSEEDGDSLGQGQIIRVQKWLTQQRVIAKDTGGRHFSFPVQFPVPFEVSSEKKRTLLKKRVRSLADIVRNFTLPKTVMMKIDNDKPSEYAIAAAFGSEPLELLRIHEDVYLHGNAVNYGSIDPTVINIPIHVSLELKVGKGLDNGDLTEWNQLLRDIDDIIAKDSVYDTTRANQKILVYMPAKNADDNDEVLGIDVHRSVSSTDDDGPDDINQAFGDEYEQDRNSTGGGSASGHSIGSGEVLEEDSEFVDGNQNGISGGDEFGEFTSYTQRTSFMLEDGGMIPSRGRTPLDLDGFFQNQNGRRKTDEHTEEQLFQGTVSKLSF
ncbi:uncharacterized protein [Amphiura filiformis]|uniref:uncharacterized protein n=1 Tax=Amphiura filiformis TaxID=82378 RepID=UPI003B21432C